MPTPSRSLAKSGACRKISRSARSAWCRCVRATRCLGSSFSASDLRAAAGLDERPYEMRIFESGCVPTREGNLHDVFNALAWLAYPKSKAQLNALHAAQIPHEQGRRGRLRDLLTIFDEGGAIVACDAADLIEMVRGFRWRELFWMSRSRLLEHMKIHVLGHAVLEQALKPWPGITCKAIFVPSASAQEADGHVATWL